MGDLLHYLHHIWNCYMYINKPKTTLDVCDSPATPSFLSCARLPSRTDGQRLTGYLTTPSSSPSLPALLALRFSIHCFTGFFDFFGASSRCSFSRIAS